MRINGLVLESLDFLLKLALCSAALSCSEPTVAPVRHVEQKISAPPDARKPHEPMVRIRYFPMDTDTVMPVTTRNIDESGIDCVIQTPKEVAELTQILASATTPTLPEHVFTDHFVRVKIFARGDDAREHVAAVVEEHVEHGVVRRGDVDKVLSKTAMRDLKGLMEARCKWQVP